MHGFDSSSKVFLTISNLLATQINLILQRKMPKNAKKCCKTFNVSFLYFKVLWQSISSWSSTPNPEDRMNRKLDDPINK